MAASETERSETEGETPETPSPPSLEPAILLPLSTVPPAAEAPAGSASGEPAVLSAAPETAVVGTGVAGSAALRPPPEAGSPKRAPEPGGGAGETRWRGRALSALAAAPRVVGLAAAGFVVLSILWVALYGLVNPPGTVLMAREKARLGAVTQSWRPLEAISPDLRRAVIAAEDARFCDHLGVDLVEMRRAIAAWRAGGRLRGASTISQQTAKNVFLWSDRSWIRKGFEFWFTALIELFWSKQRILEVYLNVAEFGEGVFGAEAAAQHAYGVTADRLGADAAARLAAVLPNPRGRNPRGLSPQLQERARSIAFGAGDLAAAGRDACAFRD